MNTQRRSRKQHLVAAVSLCALTSVGCGFCRSPVDDPNSNLPGSCTGQQPLIEPQKLDILFVIDNSGSMVPNQEGVARELVAFVDEVRKGGGVSQDFHIGVITTSVYQHARVKGVDGFVYYPDQSGKLRAVPDLAPDGGVLLGTGTERMLNGDDPDLIAKFSRLVRQGTGGSGQETPFEAIRLAVASDLATTPLDQGGNGGFLRDGARLLIVMLSDSDDCSETDRPPKVWVSNDMTVDDCANQATSLTTVSDYFDILMGLKDGNGAQRDVIYAAIAPVGLTSKQTQAVLEGGRLHCIDCPTAEGTGVRHRQMAEMWDSTLTNLDSICRASYRETLVTIAGLANVSQSLEVSNVPDEQMLVLDIIRKDGTRQTCTMSNGGLSTYDKPIDGRPGRIHFAGDCRRRADDSEVVIRMLCAG